MLFRSNVRRMKNSLLQILCCGVTWTGKKIFVFVMMVACGSVLFFCLFLLVAAVSFFTIQNLNFLDIFTYGMRDFGKYPFSVYGDAVLKVLTFGIPLALVQYYPLLYLLEREEGIWYMISPLLSLLFMVPSCWFYRFGLKNYKSSGS